MCGIAGIFDLKGTRKINRDAVQRMTDALAHRGPDGEGFYFAPGVGFGHRRLAVIDKKGGAQPFHAQTDQCVLSYNGEIYNHQALGAELNASVQIRTRSDTEVLAEGLALEGPSFLHRLRGMFAFSFWEPNRRRLTLARDRLGERPLYYATTSDGFFIFASEINALLASGMIDTDFDPQAIADYCFYGYVPDPKTIYRGVRKLPAAHSLTIEHGRAPLLQRYWRPVIASGGGMGFDDAARILRLYLDDAVAAQMDADIPLGAYLSGGTDSAGIVAAMAETGARPETFTVGFHEEEYDERPYARMMAAKFGANHHEQTADCDSATMIDEIAALFGEPFADSSAFPSYMVARETRRHVGVALSGDGADEIFAGYRRYPFYLNEEKLRQAAPLAARRAVFGAAGSLYPKLDWAPQALRFKSTFQALARPSAEAYASAVAINLPMRVQAMLSTDLKRDLDGYHPHSVIVDAMDEANSDDPLARAQYADLVTWLPGRMLVKTDRTAMAHGLELRAPYLDHQLVQWAGSLPSSHKLFGATGKHILKQALAPRVGHDYLARKKRGFDLPISHWMRRREKNPLLRLNASRRWRESGVFNETVVDRMALAHRSGIANCAQELWTVIMFDAFLRARRR